MKLDLDRVLWEQRDLGALCRARPADKTELYWPNANYGLARTLKEYAGYPLDLPVNAIIPHGVYHDRVNVFPGEKNAPLPAVLNYPDYRADAWAAVSDKLVVPSASPFLYALHIHCEEYGEGKHDLGGTLFFPAHSTSGIDKSGDWGAVMDELDALDDKYKTPMSARQAEPPVQVCIHWSDYNKGLHRKFTERGYKIVSAGSQHLPGFFTRILHLLGRHTYAASNDVGAAVYHPAAMGMQTLLIGEHTDESVSLTDAMDHTPLRGERAKVCPFCKTRSDAKPPHTPDCRGTKIAVPVGEYSGVGLTKMHRVLRADKGSERETKAEFRAVFRDGGHVERHLLALDLLGSEHFKSPAGLYADLAMVAAL